MLLSVLLMAQLLWLHDDVKSSVPTTDSRSTYSNSSGNSSRGLNSASSLNTLFPIVRKSFEAHGWDFFHFFIHGRHLMQKVSRSPASPGPFSRLPWLCRASWPAVLFALLDFFVRRCHFLVEGPQVDFRFGSKVST